MSVKHIKMFLFVCYILFALINIHDLRVVSCNNITAIESKVIVASHLDAGWLNTFEELYSGHSYHGENVNQLFTTVIQELSNHPFRRYTLAEVSFLNRWWEDQDMETRNGFKKLVESGRIEIVNGGWVANDEACVYLDDILTNFIVGHTWLAHNLNLSQIQIGWHLDSFGTSAAQAYLFAQANYTFHVFSRMSYRERELRLQEHRMIFNWTFDMSDTSLGLVTFILPQQYSTPLIRRAYNSLQLFGRGNLTTADYSNLANNIRQQAAALGYRTHLLLFCDDFFLSTNAHHVYSEIDKMIAYFQEHPELNVRLSYDTVSGFREALPPSINGLSEVVSDFFPLFENSGSIWSGYFTSKSEFKALVRKHSRYLSVLRMLYVKLFFSKDTYGKGSTFLSAMMKFEQTLSIMQHHDAVTGTMKERVRSDYEIMLTTIRANMSQILADVLTNMFTKILSTDKHKIEKAALLQDYNILEFTETPIPMLNQFYIACFNPAPQHSSLLRVPISYRFRGFCASLVVISTGESIHPDMFCFATEEVCELLFVYDLTGYEWTYFLVQLDNVEGCISSLIQKQDSVEHIEVEGQNWKITFNSSGQTWTVAQEEWLQTFRLTYKYYETSAGSSGMNPSGAYIFTPRSLAAHDYFTTASLEQSVYKGRHVTMICFRDYHKGGYCIIGQHTNPHLGFTLTTRLPSPSLRDFPNGLELFLELELLETSEISRDFMVDANGYLELKRERPFQHPLAVGVTEIEELANHVYPMTSFCSLRNASFEFSLLTDRSQGVYSKSNNGISVFLNRMAIRDDRRGVGEILRPSETTNTWHYLLWEKNIHGKEPLELKRKYQHLVDRPPHLWILNFSSTTKLGNADGRKEWNPFVKITFYPDPINQARIFVQMINMASLLDQNIIITGSHGLLELLEVSNKSKLMLFERCLWTLQRCTSLAQVNIGDPTMELNLKPLSIVTLRITISDRINQGIGVPLMKSPTISEVVVIYTYFHMFCFLLVVIHRIGVACIKRQFRCLSFIVSMSLAFLYGPFYIALLVYVRYKRRQHRQEIDFSIIYTIDEL